MCSALTPLTPKPSCILQLRCAPARDATLQAAPGYIAVLELGQCDKPCNYIAESTGIVGEGAAQLTGVIPVPRLRTVIEIGAFSMLSQHVTGVIPHTCILVCPASFNTPPTHTLTTHIHTLVDQYSTP